MSEPMSRDEAYRLNIKEIAREHRKHCIGENCAINLPLLAVMFEEYTEEKLRKKELE